MNKKVSTILTCGLMLGGSLLSSSAFAESVQGLLGSNLDPVAKFSDKDADGNSYNGANYVMVQTIGTYGDFAYGFQLKDDGTIEQIVVPFNADEGFSEEDLAKFAWTINEKTVAGTTYYTFYNVETETYLRYSGVADDKPAIVTALSGGSSEFVFGGNNPYDGSTPEISFAAAE